MKLGGLGPSTDPSVLKEKVRMVVMVMVGGGAGYVLDVLAMHFLA